MILNGELIAENIYNDLKVKIAKLHRQGIRPHLAVILVGNRADSEIFVSLKEKKARELGMEFSVYRFSDKDKENEIMTAIKYLNDDPEIHGIIVQLPLPENFETEKILAAVKKNKDVDGLIKESEFSPPAPTAILRILDEHKIGLKGKNIVIVGKGRLVGQPLERMMKAAGLKVEALDMESENIIERIRQAEVLISGTGTNGMITEDLVNKKMVVVDAAKDVNFERVKDKVESLTPAKGGVGPITVALLLENTVKAAQEQL